MDDASAQQLFRALGRIEQQSRSNGAALERVEAAQGEVRERLAVVETRLTAVEQANGRVETSQAKALAVEARRARRIASSGLTQKSLAKIIGLGTVIGAAIGAAYKAFTASKGGSGS